MAQAETTLACSEATRDRIRAFKQGGESYDTLLQKMADAYEQALAEGAP
jgi:hypothetical protein